MDRDFLYENAPLIEVIAEVQWEVVPLKVSPGAAVDPHFEAMSEGFKSKVEQRGYGHIERLVPVDVPLEMLPRQPIYRCRVRENEWPLYQVGPGIFTCNIVPKYEGWSRFRNIVDLGIKDLLESFPVPANHVHLSRLELRYIDGFVDKHGFEDPVSFACEALGIELKLRDGIIGTFAAEDPKLLLVSDVGFNVASPANTRVMVKTGPGNIKGESGLIMELRALSDQKGIPSDRSFIIEWMDSAHYTLKGIFQTMTSDALKKAMGPVRDIEGGAQ
jgi:uncharacterized protein (TIGR04255 family)